jgi:hypothetical protein
VKQKHTKQYGTGGRSSHIKAGTERRPHAGNRPGKGAKHKIETSAPSDALHIRGPANKGWLS